MKERDCANCIHHTEDGCSSWDCEFEARDLTTDLISRADAIDAVKDTILKRFNLADWYEEMLNCGVEIEDRIKALPSADSVSREFYEGAVKANIGLVIKNRELKEQLESADAVHIHNDGTLEVKVPNAQKVGRVLVMDTDSHIGGGLFYPDDAVHGWIPCSERLPSESGDYLATIPLDADETYTEVLTFHKGRFYEDDDEWGATYNDDVLAWQPLPKPYKGSDSE